MPLIIYYIIRNRPTSFSLNAIYTAYGKVLTFSEHLMSSWCSTGFCIFASFMIMFHVFIDTVFYVSCIQIELIAFNISQSKIRILSKEWYEYNLEKNLKFKKHMIFVLLIVSAIAIYGTLTAIYYIPSSISGVRGYTRWKHLPLDQCTDVFLHHRMWHTQTK